MNSNSIKVNVLESLKRLKEMDKKITLVFLVTAIVNIVSYYFTSKKFFRVQFKEFFLQSEYANLYEFLYWFIGDFISFFVLPVIVILLIHREKIKNYGFNLGNFKLGLKVTLIVIAIFVPILWIVSSFESFSLVYPHLYQARTNLSIFLIYELGMLFYMFGWEFIWRGYLLFGLEEKFDWYAIYIQMIPFVILHNGKPLIETFGAIFAGIALGVLALRTRSFLYGFIIHFSIMFSIDFFGFIRYNFNYFKIAF